MIPVPILLSPARIGHDTDADNGLLTDDREEDLIFLIYIDRIFNLKYSCWYCVRWTIVLRQRLSDLLCIILRCSTTATHEKNGVQLRLRNLENFIFWKIVFLLIVIWWYNFRKTHPCQRIDTKIKILRFAWEIFIRAIALHVVIEELFSSNSMDLKIWSFQTGAVNSLCWLDDYFVQLLNFQRAFFAFFFWYLITPEDSWQDSLRYLSNK